MILETALSFLGGSAFRMIWGELSSAWTNYQNHKHEIERMSLQGKLDGEAHQRNLEAIKLHSALGIKEIRVRAEEQRETIETDAWAKLVEGMTKPSGIWFVDLWNGVIRPAGATLFLAMITLHYYTRDWKLDDQGWTLAGAFLGFYIADRSLFKRGK